MNRTDLSKFDNSWYDPGRGAFVRGMWYLVHLAYFRSGFPFSRVRRFWLRAFGAKVGKGVVIKPHVTIKYPWNLTIGDHCWIGEQAWIDNLGKVSMGDHVCLSQGAYLLTGNHDYKKSTFDLRVEPIVLEDGVWIGAKSTVCPGVTCRSHSVLSVGSVAKSDLEPYSVYNGNPAVKVRDRVIA